MSPSRRPRRYRAQPGAAVGLKLPIPPRKALDPDLRKYFAVCDEKLGFLPGTLSEKIDPYLRPLYDALHDMIDPDSIPRLITSGTIEVAPLAYMRGRTLNDAFIILDEAQNTSAEQMKMFLTRLGFGSTIVVTGDVTQVDLPGGVQSGLRVISDILEGLDDVAFCRLTSNDVVRHKLVGRIVEAYERYDADRAQ